MQSRDPNNAKGIDVSHWQGKIDWAKVKSAGISFAIMKASEGSMYTDDTVSANIAGAKASGLKVGVYHFCRAATVAEAVKEVDFFCSVLDDIGGMGVLDIPPVLDIETMEAKTKENVTAVCHAWLEAVEKKCNVRPIIYASRSFIDDYLDKSLGKYELWLAAYDAENLPDRGGWTEWKMLQYTEKGTVPGIYGNVDLNEYNGSVIKMSITYTDVTGHWAEKAIKAVTEAGLMDGYEDGTFKPDKTMTRGELATVINHLLFQINNR